VPDTLSATQSLGFLLPEIVLTAGLLLVLLLDLPAARRSGMILGVTVVFFLLGFLATFGVNSERALLAGGMFASDPLAVFVKRFATLTSAFVVCMSFLTPEVSRRRAGEFGILLLSVTIGMCLMASASDLLTLYLSVEMVSIGSYVLAGFLKESRASGEAALKYVIFGAMASGLMIYGASLLYGLTGQTNLAQIQLVLQTGQISRPALLLAIVFIFAGIGYKVSAAPFHMWTPDVYEGAPTAVTAFLSVGPKAAGFALLIRFFFSTLAAPFGAAWQAVADLNWPLLLSVIAAATMTIGNVTALVQTNVKRMLAYSSIAHAGYILMGAVTLNQEGGMAILFYLTTYYLMNLGAFLVVILVARQIGSEEIADYRGLIHRAPFLTIAMTIFLLSLTGIPLTAGFIGKVYIFAAVVNQKIYWLALVGVLNSVVSLVYYARVFKTMTLEAPASHAPLAEPAYGRALLALLVIPTIVFGLYWGPLADITTRAFQF
jgi:NADH-quinone oxidoreductase subunit N